jgi:dynein intermediate chain
MADRTARSKALEDKKRRLEELKARRARRETAPADTPKPSANLNEYIDGLLQQSAPPTTSVAAASDAPALVPEQAAAAPQQAAAAEQASSASGDSTSVTAVAAAPTLVQKPRVPTFEFGTQTLDDDFPMDAEDEDEPAVMDPSKLEGEGADAEAQAGDEHDALQQVEPKVLNSEEKEQTVGKVPFSSFLNTASKKVERILGEPVLADLLVNFVGETDGSAAGPEAKASDGSKFVSAKQVFTHVKWTTGRNVTDLDWSPLHRELMLSAHDIMPSSSNNPSSGLLTAITPDVPPSSSLAPRSGELQADGLVLVWNLAMPTRPEHIFTCGSPVLAAKFHPTEAPLVIGGCQSGQLVIWDVRAGRLPVQRSGQGYPISAIEVMEGKVRTLCCGIFYSL